jgi:hypothetical protein
MGPPGLDGDGGDGDGWPQGSTSRLIGLVTEVTGVLPIANGGTNKSSWTEGSVVFAGASGAALTEDNTKLFWDDTNQFLGIGTKVASVAGVKPIVEVVGDGSAAVVVSTSYVTGGGGGFLVQQARGTASAPTATQSGDALFRFVGRGYDGSAFTPGRVRLDGFANQNWTATANGTYLSLLTTPDGSTTLTERMRLAAGGWMILPELAADPTTAELTSLAAMSIYMKNDKLVIAYNNAGTITYIKIPMDGSTTTWTHNTTAP